MKFLFVTYRWGNDLVGGAEIHQRRLAEELRDAGHEVEVLTTTGHQLEGFWHWGVQWKDVTGEPPSDFTVKRLSRRNMGRWPLALGCKLVQQRMEHEEAAMPAPLRDKIASQFREPWGVFLMHGWHYPEISNGEVARWTHPSAWVTVRTDNAERTEIVYRGQANQPLTLSVRAGDAVLGEKRCQPGYVEFPVALPAGFQGLLELRVSPVRRWARDHRTLGCWFNSIELRAPGRSSWWTDFSEDFRSLGRQVPDEWQAWLLDRARTRPRFYGWMFDRTRGPIAAGLSQAINQARADMVIHCNLPWGNFTSVRQGDMAMPLWHIDDEFYYWQHWIEAMQRARLVLANTPHTANSFFPPFGIRAAFVGPPIWEPDRPQPEVARAFRHAHGIDNDEILVLTVCRKAGEKRYDSIARAVTRLRGESIPVRMIGIGPDVDGLPFAFDGCRWLGKLSGQDLQCAYAACDIFALMSESESFGMVVPEAWHHGKPVVVNRLCQPVASLVDSGVDGVATVPGEELVGDLRRLAGSAELRASMGEAGRRKALEHYTKGAAARRLLKAMENQAS
ncbi:glycosyltransferase [bacterium]|nr:glycosyltransferase [bacterium]